MPTNLTQLPVIPTVNPGTLFYVVDAGQDWAATASQITGGGGTPGGSDRQMQFNNAGAFGGAADVLYQSGGAVLDVTILDAATIGVIVQGFTGQTADLQVWQDVSNNLIAQVAADSQFQIHKPTTTGGGGYQRILLDCSGSNPQFSALGGTAFDPILWFYRYDGNSPDATYYTSGIASIAGIICVGSSGPFDSVGGATLNLHIFFDRVGNVVIGNAASALATTATGGFLHIPTCAGPPTGTPTLYTGTVPIVLDTVGNTLYAYLGGSWVAI